MSVIPPKSSDFLPGSSLGFVKPMPRRGHDSRRDQGDSSEFDVDLMHQSQESALTLWKKLQPDPDEPSDSSVSCAGLKLGHFLVEQQIGRGGMGAVFRAVDTRLDREVALKVLAGTQSADKSAVDRFRNEARAAARLDHDNVARVFYVGEERGLHFIAFEFVHGANVREVIETRGSLLPAEAVNYGLQIAHALRHISAAGVVHRDVKPSNIIITPTGRAKLVDLGLARKLDPEASKDLTVDGTTLGTFDYISPEQAKDPRRVDIRSDIYSLGCTMYHMLTGEPPYPRGTMLQKLLDHQHKDVPDAASRNGNVPPELSAVVRKMMASDPADRYASADELIGDLAILAHAYGLRPVAPGSPLWAARHKPGGWSVLRRNWAWIASAALLIGGVLVIDAVQSRSGPDETLADTAGATTTNPPPRVVPPLASADAGQPRAPSSESALASNPPGALADVDAHGAGISGAGKVAPPPGAGSPEEFSGISPALTTMIGPHEVVDGGITESKLPGIDIPQSALYQSPFVPFPPSPSAIDPQTSADRQPLDDEPPPSPVVDPRTEEPPVSVAAQPELPARPFLIRIDGADPVGYASLEAACRAAPDGGVIELNFDGPLPERQRPLRIVGKRLRIRRAADRRPIVRFAVPADWQQRAEIVRMISVNRGSLEVYDVGFEVEVDPTFITDRWVLLSLSQVDEVILRGISVTMHNRNLHPASIIEIAESSAGFDDRMPDAMDRPPMRFEAEDCFFRGQADLFLDENVDPVRVRLSNVAIGLSGSLFHLRGMEAIDVLSDMNNEHRVDLGLRHVTALLAAELVRFDVEPGKSVPQLAVTANNSVMVTGGSRPLVGMSGEIDSYDAQQLLEWSGDHSFVQTPDPIWTITGPFDERVYDLAEWNDLWKQGHLARPTATNVLPRDRSIPYSSITAADLALVVGAPVPNPAKGGASDGTDAGVQWQSPRLPTPAISGDE